MKNDAMRRRAGGVKLSSIIFCVTVLVAGLPTGGRAQVNSGSDGSDGPFNPTAANTVINMTTHPTGIYQYTSVNIRSNVTVTFTPNANNTPVVWLVQGNVVINGGGAVDLSGSGPSGSAGGVGGPGGYRGGTGGLSPTSGQGPGGGSAGNASPTPYGGSGSYGIPGNVQPYQAQAGPTYGNEFLVPLLGGSGGGGTDGMGGGGGGGGAILIAASGTVQVDGIIKATGAPYAWNNSYYGVGSGGAIRIVGSRITGSGSINVWTSEGGGGRVRFDTYENNFGGSLSLYTVFSQGFQPIIIPSPGQLAQLTVTSVGGVPVSASPTGALSTPDAVLSAQQNNPIPIGVSCANLPLNTPITVTVKPMNGSPVSAVGYNTTGTQASSTASISMNIPRGGGLIYATAATSH